jgi:cephalosporin-C deacetylase-like acetyl esterase
MGFGPQKRNAFMSLRRPHLLVACLVLLAQAALAVAADKPRLVVTPDDPDGVYYVGQTVRWRIAYEGDGPAPASVVYTLKPDGLGESAKGSLPLTDGVATYEARLDAPGTLLLELEAKAADGRTLKAHGGAVATPERIEPSAPRPDDFDAFWDAKVEQLASVPPNPRLEPVVVEKPGVQYWKVTLDHVNGTHINGQLARPESGEKFPAMLIVQWAGVYPLQKGWAVDRAAEGWLTLNVLAHDLPIDEPEAFYKEQSAGPLKDYPAIGNDDRETSYFLRMYLSCYRAAEYLATRPDWDGRTLVVTGGSQGGQQALVTAALHPKVTAAMANVPAGCDMLGPDAGRSPGWPKWYWATRDKDPVKVRETSRYFDVVNFAPRIKCPVLVGVGLIDQTCPPAGILAATNLIPSPKEVVILPLGGHQNENGSHGPYDKRLWGAWLPALKQGKPAPVEP